MKPINRNSRNTSYKCPTSNSTLIHYHKSLLDNDDGQNKGKSHDFRSQFRFRNYSDYALFCLKHILVFFFYVLNIYGAIILSLFILSLLNTLYIICFEWGLQIIPQLRNNGPVCNRILGNREVEVVELNNNDDHIHKHRGKDDTRVLSKLSSQEFYDLYVRKRKVVHIRNAYDKETLSWNRELLSDASLLRDFANSNTTIHVETELKETRNKGVTTEMRIPEFVAKYRKPGAELYAVVNIDKTFQNSETTKKVRFPGLFEDFWRSSGIPAKPNMWWSAGNTKSVIHTDQSHNFESIFYGSKTFYVSDINYMDDLGWPNNSNSYKNNSSIIDFESVHNKRNSETEKLLRQFPRFKDVQWQRVDLVPGDGKQMF